MGVLIRYKDGSEKNIREATGFGVSNNGDLVLIKQMPGAPPGQGMNHRAVAAGDWKEVIAEENKITTPVFAPSGSEQPPGGRRPS